MARNFDIVRPGATQTQDDNSRAQKGNQRPTRQPCNEVMQNEDNATKTETTPGVESSDTTNTTGISNDETTRKQHTSDGDVARKTKINGNPNPTLHQQNNIMAPGASEMNISQKHLGGSRHSPWGRGEKISGQTGDFAHLTNSPRSSTTKSKNLK